MGMAVKSQDLDRKKETAKPGQLSSGLAINKSKSRTSMGVQSSFCAGPELIDKSAT